MTETMRRLLVLACLGALVACSPPKANSPTVNDTAALENAQTEIAKLQAEIDRLKAPPRVSPAAPKAVAPPRPALAEAPERPASRAAVKMCWQDYCPCDPPQGGPDKFLCQRLRAGLPVDDEQMSGAAGLREARRQIDEFGRTNPGF